MMQAAEDFLGQYQPDAQNAEGFLAQYEPQPVQQNDSILRDPAIVASGATKGFVGATSIPGEIGAAYDKYIGQPFAKAVTGETPSFGLAEVLGGTPDQNIERGKQAGFIDNPSFAPQNEGEKLLSAGGQGIGANLAMAPISGPMALTQAAIQGAGAGATGQAASDLTGGNPVAQVAGNILGGGIASGLTNLAEKGVNAVAGKGSDLLDAYKEAGISPRLVGDVSQDPTMRGIQAFASKWPLAAGRVQAAGEKTLQEFGNSIENLATKFGDARTLGEAGTAVQNEGKKWLGNFKLTSAQKWGAVDSAAGANTPVALNGMKQAIGDITSAAQGNPAISSFLKSPLVQRFIDITKSSKGAVPWQTARALKTRLGEYLENPELVADAGGAQAKMLYGALSGDMKNSLANNPVALAKFEQANAHTTQGHEFIDNVLSNVVGKDIKPETAANALIQSGRLGGTTLQAVRQHMPSAANELAAVTLRRQAAGQSQGAAGNAVSPSRWLANEDPARRMSPEAHQALYPDTAAQSKMKALDTVADSMRETEKLANHSNTAAHVAGFALTSEALAAPMAIYEANQMGGPSAAAATALTMAAPFAIGPIAGRLATSPALARFMATPSTPAPYGMAPSLLPMIGR